MRILFVYPDIISGRVYSKHLSHGVAYLSAVLRANNHLAELNLAPLTKKIRDFNPGIIAISSTSNQWGYSKKAAQFVKENFDIPIFVGGAHLTIKLEYIYETRFIAGICRGEGEYALLELVNQIERSESYFDVKKLRGMTDVEYVRSGHRVAANFLKEKRRAMI